jgi:PAS domain S-box-containing protein
MVINNGDKLMLVGLGASAGGVEALLKFFEHTPADTGMAFVVILHLLPERESQLSEVLRAKTRMPVEQVRETVRVEPNRVYVIPPGRDLYLVDGQIRLAERGPDDGHPMPVDLLFRTLADSYRERAVAVVLSGADADGSVGVRRVREQGGVTIAQDPSEAEYPSMPRAACETGAVDFVLPVASMPEKIASLHQNANRIQLPLADDPQPDADESALREVLVLLRARTRHDFSGYKRSTLLRRIERRMQVTETEDLPEYLGYIREHPEEMPRLLADLLISVTNFFRDREAFLQLEREVVPSLFEGKGAGEQVRVWAAGCATGEEAYSVAMLLIEQAERLPAAPSVQVFASDIDEAALRQAREGVYPEAVEADLTPERLKRFFVKEGQYYRVKRELREKVLFTLHNVLRDPPFSKLDLVSCRNLLIYINRETQERVLEVFHFALRSGGYLFLGSAETADALPDLFESVDKKQRVFRRVEAPPIFRGAPVLPMTGRWEARPALPLQTTPPGAEPSSYGELHYRTLEELAPPSVLVNADYEILHISERAGRFLRHAGGEPSRNLLKVAHPELQMELRSLLLKTEQGESASSDITLLLDGRRRPVRLSVRPIASPRVAPGFRLVVFEELLEQASSVGPQLAGDWTAKAPATELGDGLEPVVRQLEEELQRTREQLSATVEMYETQAEEFKANNEELQAMNEELRSASEELETSKEELQSVNEELTTVNHELGERVEELGRANSDLQNLMAATQIGTIFLNRQMRIERYTPGARELFNLIPGDVGRPLAHLTHRLDYLGLVEDAEAVLRTLHAIEREASSREGRYYLVRLIPYRTMEDRINGVVITFVDITERKRAEEALRESEEKYRTLFDSIDEGFAIEELIYGPDGQIEDIIFREVNRAYERQGGLHDVVGKSIKEVLPHLEQHWKDAFAHVAKNGEPVRLVNYAQDVDRWFDAYLTMLAGSDKYVAVVFNDITERKLHERQQEFLLKLSDALRPLSDAIEIQNTATRILGEHLQVDRVQYSDVDDKQGHWVVVGSYLRDGATRLAGSGRVEDFGAASEQLRSGKTISIADAATDTSLSPSAREAFLAIQARAVLSVPLIKEGQWVATLSLHHSSAHGWGEEEIKLAQETTERTWAAVERAKAEAALRESEEQFRRAIEDAPIPVIMHAEDGEVLQISRTWTELTGYTIEEVPTLDAWLTRAYGEGADAVREHMHELFKGHRRSLGMEFPVRTRAGEVKHWSFSASSPGALRDGRRYIVGMALDVTERHQSERRLRESEGRLQKAISIETVGVLFFRLDRHLLDANEAFARMSGYTRDELRAIEDFNVLTDAAFLEATAQTAANLATRGETPPYEKLMVRKDGSRWWGLFAPTRLSGEGRDSECVEFIIDITERKRAEEGRRASEERLRLVVESVADYAIFTTDAAGIIQTWNTGAERTFGYTPAEAIGRHIEIIFTPEDRERGAPEAEMRQALETGRAADERWHVSKRGARFYVSGVTAPLRDGEGRLTGYAKIARDLTERKQLEDALRAAHDEMEGRVRERTLELAEANVALEEEVRERRAAEGRVRSLLGQLVTVQEHERRRIARELHDTLGQQLAALSMSIEMIRAESEGRARLRSHIERARGIFDRLNSEVDFLAWELRPSVLDQIGLDAALQSFVLEWSDHFGIEAHYHGPGESALRLPPEVETNLYRILQEALQNVHKHAGATRVSVILEWRDGQVSLIVEDNGQGYDPDAEEEAGSNNGMGVTNMRERAALFGGELVIESTPGQGTTIFVRAPVAESGAGGTSDER